MSPLRLNIYIFILIIILAYPLLYYVYKFYSPDFGGNDFYFYYHLYKNFDVSKTEAPFNMRLISTFIVYIFNKTGWYYHTYIQYKQNNIEQSVFFNAILVNWLSVVITTYLIFHHLFYLYKKMLLALLSSLFYTFSFGTILFCLNPNTDGFSILLITITFILYKKQSNNVYFMYPLLLFQREFTFIILSIISFFDIFYASKKNRYHIIQLILSTLFFITYYLLRKTLFLTPMYANQITESGFMHNLFQISLNIPDFLKQALLTQNIYFIFLFLLMLNGKKNIQLNTNNLILLLTFIFITFIISRVAVANNNMGRFLHMFSPILIIQMLYPQLEIFFQKTSKSYF